MSKKLSLNELIKDQLDNHVKSLRLHAYDALNKMISDLQELYRGLAEGFLNNMPTYEVYGVDGVDGVDGSVCSKCEGIFHVTLSSIDQYLTGENQFIEAECDECEDHVIRLTLNFELVSEQAPKSEELSLNTSPDSSPADNSTQKRKRKRQSRHVPFGTATCTEIGKSLVCGKEPFGLSFQKVSILMDKLGVEAAGMATWHQDSVGGSKTYDLEAWKVLVMHCKKVGLIDARHPHKPPPQLTELLE